MSNAEAKLTARQREWLEHLRACRDANETVQAYARRRGISAGSLYQAASVLRRLGVLAAGTRISESGTTRRAPPRFVALRRAARTEGTAPSWRARLANGVVLEGSGAVDEDLLARLAAL